LSWGRLRRRARLMFITNIVYFRSRILPCIYSLLFRFGEGTMALLLRRGRDYVEMDVNIHRFGSLPKKALEILITRFVIHHHYFSSLAALNV
jgi:hypothetical protein